MTWASVADLKEQGGYLLIDLAPPEWTDDDLAQLLERAEQDIRAWLRIRDDEQAGLIVTGTAQWIDPLAPLALNHATVEQCLYRLEVGEDSLVEGAPTITGAGGITFAARAPDLLGPQAVAAMAGVASLHLKRSGCADPDPTDAPAAA
jgi:hypothetical protein